MDANEPRNASSTSDAEITPAASAPSEAPAEPAQPIAPPAPPPSIAEISSLAPASGASSPGAILAASLVRSRASYFERLSSGSRASTSGSTQGCTLTASQVPHSGLASPRHSTSLTSLPLHPLAPHPLCTMGRAASDELRLADGDLGSDSDMEVESVDTFFDKPSYTRFGSNVELSASTSYRRAAAAGGSGGSGSSGKGAQASSGGARAASSSYSNVAGSGASNSNNGGADKSAGGSEGCAAAPHSSAGPGGSGYVRSLSARFGSMAGSGGGSGRWAGAGMDGLFDDLVAHVGALLASHPEAEAQMGMVQGLSDRLLQLHAVCETLGRKEDEVEHLRGVLRELTVTRADAIRLKVQMAESLNGLQQEYYKVLRSAQLAQNTCKQHSARAAATRKQLVETQNELLRYKRAVAVLRDRNRRLRADNEDMGARLQSLEQVRLGGDVRRSACYMAIVQSQTAVLY